MTLDYTQADLDADMDEIEKIYDLGKITYIQDCLARNRAGEYSVRTVLDILRYVLEGKTRWDEQRTSEGS